MNIVRPAGLDNRRPLQLSDILDEKTQQFKQYVGPIYFDGIQVVWPPERTRIDEFTFTLANGDRVERYYGEDIGDDGIIQDMEIDLPKRDPNAMAAGRKLNRKRTRKNKKNKRNNKRKSRRHYRR
jgi:hypothetical protein